MKRLPNILRQFKGIALTGTEALLPKYETDFAYLLSENDSLSKFIDRLGKRREQDIDLYNFYAAYNIKFPVIPATVSLISNRRSVAFGIRDFNELLTHICAHSTNGKMMAVFLAIQDREPEEMLKLKRDILQQFIYLRIYMPIIIDENFNAALKTLDEITGSQSDEKTEITFLGTKKSGKSSLINAILGAEYTPAGSELPTPNKVTYRWGADAHIRLETEGKTLTFDSPEALKNHLANEFRRAGKTASALAPMIVEIPNFPEDFRDFEIADTPGPNFASSTEHSLVVKKLLKKMQHCVFVMNYSAHLTNDEVSLFDSAYRVFNNKRRHQTMIVAVNRIDEMYAAEVIKSYERFADYVRGRLNALGYENIVVVSISALTAVYTDKIRKLMVEPVNAPLEKQLKTLRKQYKGTEHSTVVNFVAKALDDILDFHGVEIESLEALRQSSRVEYLVRMTESMYDPAEQFEWIDETFADVLDEEFDSDEEFFERVLEYAEQGNPDAMLYVGMLYHDGRGVAEDLHKAFEWYMKAAELGNTNAKILVASYYRHVDKNIPKAIEWFNAAIADGSTDAMCQLAWMYRMGNDVEKDSARAFELFLRAANAGEDEAILSVGMMYFNGEGVERDLRKAFDWNIRAAELDNIIAMCNVAYCYTYGEGVDKNIPKAIEWLNKAIDASDGNNADALHELSKIYRKGEGVGKDLKKAFELCKKAAELDNVNAMTSLGAMYYNGEGVSKDAVKSFEWQLKAAELGDVVSMNNTAYCYREGDGTEKNLDKAVEWYNKAIKAANGENPVALFALSRMYDDGLGVDLDERRAFSLCKKAAELEYEPAYEPLAFKYHMGLGTDVDFRRAFEWHKKAAELGNVDAMSCLGLMYENGDYVSEDQRESTRWYKKAAELGDVFSMKNLAYNYAQGRGIGRNIGEATYWYERAVESGDKDAIVMLANVYYDQGYYTKAFKYYKRALDDGDESCLVRLGQMYYEGEGTEQNYYKALQLFKRAVELHNDYYGLMNRIGNMYWAGEGTAVDYGWAAHWYRKSAEGGFAWAKYNLACCYRDGLGVSQDSDVALRWFSAAADDGIDDALEEIGHIYYNKKNDDGYRNALYWYKRAAEKGNANCMNRIGVMYNDGTGTQTDFGEAMRWYKKAAAKGHAMAMRNIGFLYRYGNGVSQSYEIAIDWLKKSLAAGNEDAQEDITATIYMQRAWEHEQEEIRKAKERERNRSSSGGCFITTAVCRSLDKGDDCRELRTFRAFRDGWMSTRPEGRALIEEYYRIAPSIVERIDARDDSARIYRSLWTEYLAPCLLLIERGENEACERRYIEMVEKLSGTFAIAAD